MIFTSFQKAYGNLYSAPSDIYEAAYATGIETLLPSTASLTDIFTTGKLPQTALFSSTPPAPPFASITPPTGNGSLDALFALGFGTNNLMKNSARLAYLQDAMAHPDGVVPSFSTGMPAAAPASNIRIAAKKNDLRGWTPAAPVLLCAGNGDPTVFYSLNTQVMGALWAPLVTARLVTVLDVDSLGSSPGPATDPFYVAKAGFAQAKAATAASGGASAVVSAYHGSLVPPFCNAAASAFFKQL